MLMLLIATYIAGWISHKRFHNRNLDENVAAAIQLIESKRAQVEVVNELGDLVIVKGESDQVVDDVVSAVNEVQRAARQ